MITTDGLGDFAGAMNDQTQQKTGLIIENRSESIQIN